MVAQFYDKSKLLCLCAAVLWFFTMPVKKKQKYFNEKTRFIFTNVKINGMILWRINAKFYRKGLI